MTDDLWSSSPLRSGARCVGRGVCRRTQASRRNPVDRLQDQKVINAACTHSGSPGMPDRDECDWDVAELYYMGHLEVNIALWKGSVLLHRADETAEAQNY
jgi:hypothetical protein